MAKIIRAVAGILQIGPKVFMASRPLGKTHALSWEFPGGKLEYGETPPEALVRELYEEIGVKASVDDCVPFTFINQSYAHGDVELEVLKVSRWQGDPTPCEGQETHWQDITVPCDRKPLLITTQRILDLLVRSYVK